MEGIDLTEGIAGALLAVGITWGALRQQIATLREKVNDQDVRIGKYEEDVKRVDRENLKHRGRMDNVEAIVLPAARRGISETLSPETRRHT